MAVVVLIAVIVVAITYGIIGLLTQKFPDPFVYVDLVFVVAAMFIVYLELRHAVHSRREIDNRFSQLDVIIQDLKKCKDDLSKRVDDLTEEVNDLHKRINDSALKQ